MAFIKNIVRTAPQLIEYLLFFLVALIPFSVRHVFDSSWNFQTGAYSDFTSLSLYISDLVLILIIFIFILSFLYQNFISPVAECSPIVTAPKVWLYFAGAAVLWLILELFFQTRATLPFQLYFSVRIVFLIAFTLIVSQIRVSREKLAWLFTILGALQSLLAIFQFYAQKSLGLYLLGESHLSPGFTGIAKIVSHGTTLIRAYGTFPHANLLSAFLIPAILFNLYLLIKKPQLPRGILLYLMLAANIFGIFLTFSRGGILALGVALVVFFTYFLINKQFSRGTKLAMPIILVIIASIAILAPYLSTRTTVSDNSTKERLFYDNIGEKMISDKPFFGVGAGLSVLHMKQYSETELQPWETQPIHNYYLISWAEWGIGAIFLIILIVYPIIALFKRNFTEFQVILAAIGVAFLVLGLFDHYFYTIWPTQLLLWLIVGLCLREFHVE
ncbi:MAG TPA: O-antigen ligase family protein [Patescibacteria group bacterium]|jgi:O-antigen ligase|nr:O-antigen ligase family protein [Patescibacteria group bacterium]